MKTFKGIKSIKSLFSKEIIKIVATDGYTEIFDCFEMNFNKVPITIIINYLIAIFGPIFAFFGLIKHKEFIHLYLKILFNKSIKKIVSWCKTIIDTQTSTPQ